MSNERRKRVKNRCKKVLENKSVSDITLNDYANSSEVKMRTRKSEASILLREVKQLSIQEDNRAWDEKLNDFEGDFESVNDKEVEKVSLVKKERRRKKTDDKSDMHEGGSYYPLDIWCLLSEYIRPEDVATFSRICKSALIVVNTPKFWLSLYRRYYKPVDYMPEHLKPKCIVRHYGLKGNVIRALNYMYPPYVRRSLVKTPVEAAYELISRQCISMWYEKCMTTKKYCYNFKLMRKDAALNQVNNKKIDMLELLSDIFANREDGCKILKVSSSVYVQLPTVMGLTLQSVDMNVDPFSVCLQLVFGSGLFCNGKFLNAGATTVLLKPVVKVKVLDWWQPEYPHNHGIIFSQSEEH